MLLLDRLALGAGARGGLALELVVLLDLGVGQVLGGEVLEDGLVLDHLELGLEVLGVGVAGRVAAAARVGHVVAEVLGLLAGVAPILGQ